MAAHNYANTSVEMVVYDDPLHVSERVAVAAFLAGYSGGTRTSYTTDLRIFTGWCHEHRLNLFSVKRAHLELFGRWMEQEGRMASTIARRLSTLSSFYKYCQIEDIIAKNPAANIRRPKVNAESRTLGLDRNELGALLVQAGLGDLRDGTLITLLALNGLRISEALNADIGDLSTERGHRTLAIVRKGGKHVTVPIAPRTGRALDLYIGGAHHWPDLPWRRGRPDGPVLHRSNGQTPRKTSWDRQAHLATQPSPLLHHRCARRGRPASAMSKKQQATRIPEPLCATTERGEALTGTQPMSCRPLSLEPPGQDERSTMRYEY